MEKKREYNIDFLRIIACFAVIGLHTFESNTISSNIIYYLCGFAVPTFFMISGYFLLNKGIIEGKYVRKKIFSIIRLVLCWNFLIKFTDISGRYLDGETISFNIIDFLIESFFSFFQIGTLWQFWYVGALLIIYLTLPFLTKISEKNRNILFVLVGILLIIIDMKSIINKSPIELTVSQTLRLWTWFFYLFLGGKIKIIKEKFYSKINITIHFVLLIGITILNLFYQFFVTTYIYERWIQAEFFYINILEIIWIVLIFLFILRINFSNRMVKIIKMLSPLTFGIYIIHPIVQKIVLVFIPNITLIDKFVSFFVILMLTFLYTWFLTKTSFKRVLLII